MKFKGSIPWVRYAFGNVWNDIFFLLPFLDDQWSSVTYDKQCHLPDVPLALTRKVWPCPHLIHRQGLYAWITYCIPDVSSYHKTLKIVWVWEYYFILMQGVMLRWSVVSCQQTNAMMCLVENQIDLDRSWMLSTFLRKLEMVMGVGRVPLIAVSW